MNKEYEVMTSKALISEIKYRDNLIKSLREELRDGKDVLRQTVLDCVDNLMYEIKVENINEDKVVDRVYEMANNAVIYYCDCWNIVHYWDGDVSNLGAEISWKDCNTVDDLVTALSYYIVVEEIQDELNQQIQGEFDMDLSDVAGTFVHCERCGAFFSTEVDDGHLTSTDTLDGLSVCGDCRYKVGYFKCSECDRYFTEDQGVDSSLCSDCFFEELVGLAGGK